MSITALTTQFVPKPSCIASGNFWNVYGSSALNEWAIWQLGPPITSDCFPVGYAPQSTAFYSPAQCPSGYTAAIQIVNTYVGSVIETTQTCCPSGLEFSAQPTSNTIFDKWPVLKTMLCTVELTAETTVTATKSSAGMQAKTTATFGQLQDNGDRGGINAYGVIVRFQSKDFPSTPTVSSSLVSSSTVPSPTLMTSSSSTPSSGLSTGAKAGIGAGVGCSALIILAVSILAIAHGRKRKNYFFKNIAHYGTDTAPIYYAHEMPTKQHDPVEMEANPTRELDATSLGTAAYPAEMNP